ncbi:MAG: hypothetical protein BIFFINMI_02552 [Phycisphaerae bacterium]|nr:hypothetical protein [Phycisphaerae bacterium]
MDPRPAYLDLLDPMALAKLGRLELIARQVVEGFVSGRHKSPYKGFSVEFAEHREYSPGDDIRDIDWRVYGKSDRYYIKQYEEETNLRANILLDASGSMAYAGKTVSKFRYAQMLAASLAHLMLRQSDAVGLVTYDSTVRRYIPPRSRASHLRAMLEEMSDTQPGGETSLGGIFHDVAERIFRRGLVVVISDLFDDVDRLLGGLHHFRYKRHEVLLIHVMAPEELTFPFTSWTQFRNLERADHRLQLDPRSVRDQYLQAVASFVGQLRRETGRMEIDYIQVDTATPFDVALSGYLGRRMARKKK